MDWRFVLGVDWRFIVIVGVAANLDNLGVGVSYGLRGVRLGWQANGLIAAIAFAVTIAAMGAGRGVAVLLPVLWAGRAGAAVLFLLGLWLALDTLLTGGGETDGRGGNGPGEIARPLALHDPVAWLEVMHQPHLADTNRSGAIDLRESVLLGIALSLNNFGTGIGAGLGGHPILLTALLTAAGSWVALAAGTRIGRVLRAGWFHRGAGLLAALLLMAVGVAQWR